jgi:23S rRNA pseudouridine1911/1915/1917 synthase
MQSLGHPLVGDPVYGKKRSADALLAAFARQALHAERLEFEHPVSQQAVAWTAPLPADMSALLAALQMQARA